MKNRAEAPIFHTAVCVEPKQPLLQPGNCICSFPARASLKELGMESKMISNKSRLLRLLKYLYRNSDEEHMKSRFDIVAELSDEESSYSRHTVADDIRALIAEGYDIEISQDGGNQYYYGTREFELPELKLLIDAVSACKFITPAQSRTLIGKLNGFASIYQAGELTRHIYIADDVKPTNRQVYYIVNDINDAINRRKRLEFLYQDYDADKKKVLRHGGEVYSVSPYGLVWDSDHYYMVAYSERRQMISQFRVDRMKSACITDKDAVPAPEDFVMKEYVQEMFGMYGGEPVSVRLECDNDMMNAVVDKFGESVQTHRHTAGTFIADVKVKDSPTFYAWVFMFDGKIRIDSPGSVRSTYLAMLERAAGSAGNR